MNILIPNLGEGSDSGFVVSILVKEGDPVKKNQVILELENEKAVAPIPSPYDGVVGKILIKVGDKVSAGQAVISLAGEGVKTDELAGSRSQEKISNLKSALTTPQQPATGKETNPEDYTFASKSGLPPPASPTVRTMAHELGIDLMKVRGSGDGGRVTVEDLKAYIDRLKRAASPQTPAAGQGAAPEKIDFSKWGPVTLKPLSALRVKIAEKMSQSWTTIPHVTQFDEADVTALLKLKKDLTVEFEKKGSKLTMMPFIIQAVVKALKKFPILNSSYDEIGGQVVLKEYYHLGIAVDTEAGLIVPVLKDADKKNLFEISKELETLSERTRQRTISLEDLRGGSFTISNLGGMGVGAFSPIINKPEVAILGVGKAQGKPVYINNQIENRFLMPLCLSYDHRVIDGAEGARFIREIVAGLQKF